MVVDQSPIRLDDLPACQRQGKCAGQYCNCEELMNTTSRKEQSLSCWFHLNKKIVRYKSTIGRTLGAARLQVAPLEKQGNRIRKRSCCGRPAGTAVGGLRGGPSALQQFRRAPMPAEPKRTSLALSEPGRDRRRAPRAGNCVIGSQQRL